MYKRGSRVLVRTTPKRILPPRRDYTLKILRFVRRTDYQPQYNYHWTARFSKKKHIFVNLLLRICARRNSRTWVKLFTHRKQYSWRHVLLYRRFRLHAKRFNDRTGLRQHFYLPRVRVALSTRDPCTGVYQYKIKKTRWKKKQYHVPSQQYSIVKSESSRRINSFGANGYLVLPPMLSAEKEILTPFPNALLRLRRAAEFSHADRRTRVVYDPKTKILPPPKDTFFYTILD